MTEWLLENGPWAGRRVTGEPARALAIPVETRTGFLTVLYVYDRMDGDTIVARYEGWHA